MSLSSAAGAAAPTTTTPPPPSSGSLGADAAPTSTTAADPWGLGQFGKESLVGFDGNTATADDIAKQFAGLNSPAQIAAIQQLLYEGGFYTSSNYTPLPGVIRPEDMAAFAAALKVTAQSGGNLTTYLTQAAALSRQLGVGVGKQQVSVIRLTGAADLSETLDKAFASALGRDATPEEKSRFVARYQAEQMQTSDDAIQAKLSAKQAGLPAGPDFTQLPLTATGIDLPNAEYNPTAGWGSLANAAPGAIAGPHATPPVAAPGSQTAVVQAPPSPAGAALEEAKTGHNTEYVTHNMLQAFDVLDRMLAGSHPGLPGGSAG